MYSLFYYFLSVCIEKTTRGNETSSERIQRVTTCKKHFQEETLVYKLTLTLNVFL